MKEPNSKTILVVEDQQDLRVLIQQALELDGYSVVTATNGLEALNVLKEGLKPKLILLDLTMPVMDGWEFLDQQKQSPELKKIPVIVLTAAATKKTPDGVAGFLKKPFALDILLKETEKAVSDEQ